jgi:hypothetical protein
MLLWSLILNIPKGIQQSDAINFMADLILLSQKNMLFPWSAPALSNCVITRLRECLIWIIAALVVASGCPAAAMAATNGEEVVVFRSAYCECCEAWESHRGEAGFVVQDHIADDIEGIKEAMARVRICRHSHCFFNTLDVVSDMVLNHKTCLTPVGFPCFTTFAIG